MPPVTTYFLNGKSMEIHHQADPTDPKSYIHLLKMVAANMKHWALISLLFMLSACSTEGTMYLYSGSDAYGQGLSYPGYSSPLSLSSFVAGNNTTAISPVFLITTIYRPEFRFMSQNRSSYYHPILPLWPQFAFYLPFPSIQDWFSDSYGGHTPSAKNFLRDDWKPAAQDYGTPAIRQFMQQDSYLEGVEPHNDPDRMGISHFLDDDEPPGRPLL